MDARAWTTGDGPKALFDAAAGWLREGRVLLPGASRLARLVGTVREAANQRLWDALYGMLGVGQRVVLLGRYSFQLPDLPGGMRPLRAPDTVDE